MLEYTLLRRTLIRRIGYVALPAPLLVRLWTSAVLAAAVAWTVKRMVIGLHPIILAVVVLGAYGLCYILMTLALRVPEATAVMGRFTSGRRKVMGRL
jgi:nitrate reductase NapE component